MDNSDMRLMIEDLRDHVDRLEIALAPLLQANLTEIGSKLPLLDKAKLSVLATYAMESILFSVLKLNGVDAKEHPVFSELTRVKQYFQKIKDAESGGPDKRKPMRLDNQAASRFIRQALAGNDKIDRQRDEKLAGEKANAQRKLEAMQKAKEAAEQSEEVIGPKKRRAISQSEEDSAASDGLTDADYTGKHQQGEGHVLLETDEKSRQRKKAKKEAKKAAKKATERKANGEGEEEDKDSARQREQRHKRKKSSKPPRDGKTVFSDLLSRANKVDDSTGSEKHKANG